MKTVTRKVVSAALAICLLASAAPAQGELATPAQLHAAREYVKKSWRTLARSNLGLAAAAVDPKSKPSPTGSQWDAPFGWAPMQLIAVEGLRRYGYAEQADRVSQSFLSLVLKEFVEHNVIVEKYDVLDRDSQVSSGLRFGYTSNEIGFGWTNAVFVELYAQLPVNQRHRVRELKGPRQF